MIISARNDLVFQKLFSSNEHKIIPIGFIQDVLKLDIKDIKIGNPYSIDNYSMENDMQQKLLVTVVDVIVETKNGQKVIIEMQKMNHTYFTERALFYLCQKFVENYGVKDEPAEKENNNYKSLNATHAIIVADFILWEDSVALRSFTLKDENNNEYKKAPNGEPFFSLTFFELPKEIQFESEEIKQWRNYFLDRELNISAPEYIKYASDIIRKYKLGKEEIEMIIHINKAQADYYAILNSAVETGEKRGIKQGRKQGHKQGHRQGHKQAIVATAKKLLEKGQTLTFISEITGLSQDEIETLK